MAHRSRSLALPEGGRHLFPTLTLPGAYGGAEVVAAAGFKEVVVANSRLFEEIEELEEDLVERWVQLLDQT